MDIPPPKILKVGPAAAPIAIHFKILRCCSGSSLLNLSAISDSVFSQGFDACKPSRNASTNGPPNSIPKLTASFRSIFNLDSVVSSRMLASLAKALFSLNALLPPSIALVIKSPALAARSKVSRKRTSVIPISSKTAIADLPCFSDSPNPLINRSKATSGLDLNS